MIEVLGPMPARMLRLWKGRRSVVNEDGSLLREHVKDPCSDPLDVRISKRIPKNMTLVDFSAYESFLRSTLQYEPGKRPSAEELLCHRWLLLLLIILHTSLSSYGNPQRGGVIHRLSQEIYITLWSNTF